MQSSNDSYFMKLAIKEARKSKESIGCGVVIVKGDKVIAKSFNKQREKFDASAHAEINAIRLAGKKLLNKNLDRCIIYCTCEPCSMCLSAIIFAKIEKLVYGVTMQEAYPDNRPVDVSLDFLLSKTDRPLKVIKGYMKEECKELLR